jgi:predicted dinucleotide-binding enzyme
VLVAIPLKAYQTIPVAPLEGKIVLDANNYYPERDGHIGELDRDEITTSELLARHLPKSKVVKVFNAIQAAHIESDGRPAGSPDRRAHPIAGDDAAAKKTVNACFQTRVTLFQIVDYIPDRRTFDPNNFLVLG